MDVRELRYFLTVAEELHFGRAAERLHIVQSAVSQQVRRLENELRVTLFARSTRSVRLTDAGERLVPHARNVLAALEAARADMAELRAEQAVTLRLGTSSGLGARLDALLTEVSRLDAGTRVELVTGGLPERLSRVVSGELDATLVRGVHEAPGLELLPLWEDALIAAVPAHHELAAREVIDLADLAPLPLRIASAARNPALHALVADACREAGFEPVRGPEFTTAQDTLAVIGHDTPSWTVFYAPHADQLPVPGVAFRPLRRPAPMMRSYLAVRPGPPSRQLRTLIAACHHVDDASAG